MEQTPAEQTTQHMDLVFLLCLHMMSEIKVRAYTHDASKFGQAEWPHFERETPLLKTLTYGGDEYKESLARLKPALDHHYANNRHHPEHFENGVAGMTLVDLVEMFCDWIAASQRSKGGDPIKGIEISAKRFDMPTMLEQIFKNSAAALPPIETFTNQIKLGEGHE